MLNFFDNPRDNILGLQALVLACIFIIGAMLYYIGSNTDELQSEISALQNEVNTTNIIKAIAPLLSDTPERKKMLKDFEQIRRSLGLPGVYERAAKSIIVR